MLITMKESEKSFEFTIDNLETLSIKNNWCSWCVNVFISDPSGEWNSCGTGLLSFFGKKKQKSTLSKLQSIKDLKTDAEIWEPNMFTMQVRSNKNLANNNKDIKLDPELKKKLNMNGSDDLILHCELKKASQCSLSELVIMWYQEDIDIADEREIICKITGSELQDNFKIHIDYLDHILNNLQAKEEDLINKKLTVAVFCSKLDSVKDLIKIYKSVTSDQPNYKEVTSKVQRIAMLLLEEWQLDILLHVLNEDVFYDMLDLFRDMHLEKCPTANYREFFVNQTHFINFFNFPQNLIDVIRLRYKIMFLKDYIFCDHQKEEFLNYLNSIIEIPNSSIFLYLTENNSVFLHLLEQINSQSEQFFNEFFSIYKPLSNDSKALFAVTFLMKNLHIHYMEKTFHYLKSRAPDRHKVLNLVEMLTILVTSKKENAVKLFNSKFEVEGEKASFSTILNLMLADPLESRLEADLELRDCAANIISLMTESVIADKVSHINLLNSYLLPEMADSIQKTPESELSWKYYYSFVKLIALCIDKENNTNSCNNFLVTNLINYKILQAMPAVYDRFQRHKPFQINFLQFTNTMMAIQEEEVIKVLLENSFLRIVWNCFKANYKKENIVFSICLKVFSDIERLKSQTYLDYFIDTFQDEISLPQFSCFPAIAKLMLRYRTLHSDPQATGPIDGQFSEGSSPGRSSGEGGKLDTAPTEGVKDFSIISSTNQEILRDMEEILIDEDKEKGASGTNMIEEQSNGAVQHAPEGAQGHLLGKREPLEG